MLKISIKVKNDVNFHYGNNRIATLLTVNYQENGFVVYIIYIIAKHYK